MSINPDAALDGAVALVRTVAGLQNATDKGVPASLPTTVRAYVALLDVEYIDAATGGYTKALINLGITLGRRVLAGTDPAVATSEKAIADMSVELSRNVLRNRRNAVDGVATMLGGSVVDMDNMDWSLANSPEYRPIAGQEYRLYPGVLRVRQDETIT